jgi:serine/threonine protein phosphatase PrpC
MGTTVVAAVIRDNRFAIVWAGDSRAYVLRDGVLHQLSRDHTRVQELIDRGFLTVEQSAGHPMSHVLSRAVGVMDDVELEAVTDDMHAGDIFLLCSDGLYGVVSEDEIAHILNTLHIDEAGAALVAKCLDNGAPDNVTVVLIKASEATVLSFAPYSPVSS